MVHTLDNGPGREGAVGRGRIHQDDPFITLLHQVAGAAGSGGSRRQQSGVQGDRAQAAVGGGVN